MPCPFLFQKKAAVAPP